MVALERSSHGPEVEVIESRGPNAQAKKTTERTRRAATIVFALLVFAALLVAEVFPGEWPKNSFLAMMVFLSILWATEAIPLYVTSMLVPALTVLLKILPAEDGSDGPMSAPDAAQRVFSVRFCTAFTHWQATGDCKTIYLTQQVDVHNTQHLRLKQEQI